MLIDDVFLEASFGVNGGEASGNKSSVIVTDLDLALDLVGSLGVVGWVVLLGVLLDPACDAEVFDVVVFPLFPFPLLEEEDNTCKNDSEEYWVSRCTSLFSIDTNETMKCSFEGFDLAILLMSFEAAW